MRFGVADYWLLKETSTVASAHNEDRVPSLCILLLLCGNSSQQIRMQGKDHTISTDLRCDTCTDTANVTMNVLI